MSERVKALLPLVGLTLLLLALLALAAAEGCV